MAFPTSSIVDTFNRTNENPLATASSGATWASFSGSGGVGLTALQVQSNVCASTSASSLMYVVGADGADCEVYATVTTKGGTGAIVDLALGVIDTGTITTVDGYMVRFTVASGTDTIEIVRLTNLAVTVLTTYNQEVTAGDSFGLSRVGTTLEAWYNSAGGGWSSLGTTTDSTHTGGGVKAMGIYSTTTRIDDFSGGSVVGGATSFAIRRRNRSFNGLLVR